MSGRPARTILLAGRDVLARADVLRRGDPPAVTLGGRPGAATLAEAVEAAARLGGPLARATWVLSDELVTADVTLPRATVERLPAAELARALGFEVQSVTGWAPLEAAIGWRAVPDAGPDVAVHVVEAARDDVAAVAAAVERLGGRLAGLVHPAGLPAPLDPAVPPPWRRVETWRDGVVTVEDAGDGPRRRARADATAPGHVEALLAAPGRDDDLGADRVRRLEAPDDARAFLVAWAATLGERAAAVAVVPPPARPVPAGARAGLAAALALAVGGAGVAHHGHVVGETARLAAARAEAVAPADALARARRDLKGREHELEGLRRDEAEATATAAALARARTRLSTALLALADGCPADARIDALDVGLHRVVVEGHAVEAASVDCLASAVAEVVEKDGLPVAPPVRTFDASVGRAGAYRFEVRAEARPTTPKEDAP